MEVWASYSLDDLLLFSPTTYFRLYELHNSALWPVHLLKVGIALVLLMLTRNRGPGWGWVVFLLLGILWGFVGWFFLYQQYAQINTAAPWFGLGFGLQSLLLLAVAVSKTNGFFIIGVRSGYQSIPGLVLFLYALVMHPFIGIADGRTWAGVEIFGMAPDPTALGTLGILMIYRGKLAVLLAAIPVLWLCITGLTHLAMSNPTGMIPIGAFALALVSRWLMPHVIRQ